MYIIFNTGVEYVYVYIFFMSLFSRHALPPHRYPPFFIIDERETRTKRTRMKTRARHSSRFIIAVRRRLVAEKKLKFIEPSVDNGGRA